MSELPMGTVTFLFTDVEGSTRLWEEAPAAMRAALARHDELIEALTARHGGRVVRPRGEGDSRFCVFARATDAVAAAAAMQRALHDEAWSTPRPIRVRMALHIGEADVRDGDYYGSAVNRCARLRGIAHGGQVLLSGATAAVARGGLGDGLSLRELGRQRLRDLGEPEEVCQVVGPALAEGFPPLKSLDALPNNLPVQVTSFVGRERELAEVQRLLGTTRLLTLAGTGGAGKTRLSLQVAADLIDAYADGVWFVDLAPLSDESLAPTAMLTALGVGETPGQTPIASLLEYLRQRQTLIVLDNCEHMVEACARLADALIRGCPGVQMLATSREMLGVSGETAWRIPSLPLPPAEWGTRGGGDAKSVGSVGLVEYEAVRLFVERARAVLPAFSVTDANAAAVAQVCRRLDGIPLAIELAAARVRVMTVEQIAARLNDRFRLLTGGGRTALRRQQTLQALVDWSHDLLNDRERALFRRLAVFAGGWTIEAAEAVCGDGDGHGDTGTPGHGETGTVGKSRFGLPASPALSLAASSGVAGWEILDLLTSLADKSLVVGEARGAAERYRFLETMRQYAEEKLLQSGEAEEVRNRHLEWCVSLSRTIGAEPPGPRRRAVLEALAPELDNLRTALTWSLSSATAAEAGVEIMAGFASGVGWPALGATQGEARGWLEAILQVAQDRSAARVSALLYLGHILRWDHEFTRAQAVTEEVLAIAGERGDEADVARARAALGLVLANQGDYAQGINSIEDAIDWARQRNDRFALIHYLRDLGVSLMSAGQLERARAALQESFEVAERTGGYQALAALYRLAILDRLTGDHARARELTERCDGQLMTGDYWGAELVRLMWGNLARAEGRFDEARAELVGVLRRARSRGEGRALREMIAMIGILEIAAGAPRRGVQIIAAASQADGPIGTVHVPEVRVEVPEHLELARAAMGQEAYDAAWATGQGLSLEELVALAVAPPG